MSGSRPGLYPVALQRQLLKACAPLVGSEAKEHGAVGGCPFYDHQANQCKVYAMRPLLCFAIVDRARVKIAKVVLPKPVASIAEWFAIIYAKKFGVRLPKYPMARGDTVIRLMKGV